MREGPLDAGGRRRPGEPAGRVRRMFPPPSAPNGDGGRRHRGRRGRGRCGRRRGVAHRRAGRAEEAARAPWRMLPQRPDPTRLVHAATLAANAQNTSRGGSRSASCRRRSPSANGQGANAANCILRLRRPRAQHRQLRRAAARDAPLPRLRDREHRRPGRCRRVRGPCRGCARPPPADVGLGEPVAVVKLRPSAPHGADLAAAILERRTHRGAYDNRDVPERAGAGSRRRRRSLPRRGSALHRRPP